MWVQDLREWVEYHRDRGVMRFYIMDSNSTKPSGRQIADYISSGLIDYYYRCPTDSEYESETIRH